MLDEALTVLAAAGGTAVVQAAGTDAWTGLRQAVGRLFGRGEEEHAARTEERLDGTAAALEAAGREDAEQVRTRQAVAWQTRFEDLLAGADGQERTQVVHELRALVHAYAPGRTGGGEVSGNTFHGPTAIQTGDHNRQINHFGPGA
ncbi:hypothetical protein E2C00_17355 [Streptomyces sp. WAC05374]|uniref:hypothetical protein n=1 Tax=Streptomyces sp. WAC05374 TaxID=2487420 RepID=UPI000F87FC75|nr:hypothetical protein [Streptomyces sp. WAC05374]RST16476.1 hypothetical protein EF905_12130 [Streptomyces sp. WAC05374]TDF54678.1 hypothetical protein E2C00_17355 [Streptomyces sp. WAC05374]TDF56314.1 hypothetical protein E2C02_12810 [Streptomyces sp. WAC05374]